MLLTISGINERTMVKVRMNSLIYAEGPVGHVNAAIAWIDAHQFDHLDIEFGDLMEESVYKRVMEDKCLQA